MIGLEELRVYRLAMEFAERIWALIRGWDKFPRDTLGKQLIRAVDSIAANIAEGFGRYHYKENRQFCFYARGSLFEVRTWLAKAANRGFISPNDYKALDEQAAFLGKMLNRFTSSIGQMTNDPLTNDPMTNEARTLSISRA